MTSPRSGTELPFVVRLHTALGADGSTIQPPKMPSGINVADLTSVGIIPPNLRGLAAMHFEAQTAMRDRIDRLAAMRLACSKGDCACKKGFNIETFGQEAKEIFRQLRLLTELLAINLKKKMGGFGFSSSYVIGPDWSVLPTPKEDERRMNEALDAIMKRGESADVVGDVIAIVGMRRGGSPSGGAITLHRLVDLLRGGRRPGQYAGSA